MAVARGPAACLTGWLAPVHHGVGDRGDVATSGEERWVSREIVRGREKRGLLGAACAVGRRPRRGEVGSVRRAAVEPATRLISPRDVGPARARRAKDGTGRRKRFDAIVACMQKMIICALYM